MGHQLFIYNNKDTFPAKMRLSQVIKSLYPSEVSHYHASKSFSFDTLLSQLISPRLSLVGNHRHPPQVLVVWNYEKSLNEKKVLELLNSIGNNTVFLISSENEKKGAKQVISNHTKTLPKVNFFSSQYLDYRNINQRIEHFFESNELKGDRNLVKHLSNHFQKKINAVEDAESDPVGSDLEKIKLSFSPRERLSIEKIDSIIDELQEERNQFEVVDAFFRKDIRLTLTNLLVFLQNSGNLISLVQRLVFQTTQLIQIKEELTDNHSLDVIFKNLKIYFDFQKTKLKRANSMFKFHELVSLLEDFIGIEKTLKSENLVNRNIIKKKVNLKAKLALEKTIILRLKN